MVAAYLIDNCFEENSARCIEEHAVDASPESFIAPDDAVTIILVGQVGDVIGREPLEEVPGLVTCYHQGGPTTEQLALVGRFPSLVVIHSTRS